MRPIGAGCWRGQIEKYVETACVYNDSVSGYGLGLPYGIEVATSLSCVPKNRLEPQCQLIAREKLSSWSAKSSSWYGLPFWLRSDWYLGVVLTSLDCRSLKSRLH